jgi:hypothetical protein
MQFTVETGSLRESAAAIEEVLARLERFQVVEDLTAVGGAFRGSESAGAAGRACSTWGMRLSSLRWRVRATGVALEVAAAGYDTVEEVARHALRPSGTPGALPAATP